MTPRRPAAACVKQQRCETRADSASAVRDGKNFFRASALHPLLAKILEATEKARPLTEASLLATHWLITIGRNEKCMIR
jgi:hypothetical protein